MSIHTDEIVLARTTLEADPSEGKPARNVDLYFRESSPEAFHVRVQIDASGLDVAMDTMTSEKKISEAKALSMLLRKDKTFSKAGWQISVDGENFLAEHGYGIVDTSPTISVVVVLETDMYKELREFVKIAGVPLEKWIANRAADAYWSRKYSRGGEIAIDPGLLNECRRQATKEEMGSWRAVEWIEKALRDALAKKRGEQGP